MRKFTDIDFGSSRYDELVELRYKILLEPLGLKFLDSFRDKEAGYLHIGCIEGLDDKLVGGLILAPVNDEEVRMMQVAVDTRYQREGIGREMVRYAEKRAKASGFSKIVMHLVESISQPKIRLICGYLRVIFTSSNLLSPHSEIPSNLASAYFSNNSTALNKPFLTASMSIPLSNLAQASERYPTLLELFLFA